MTSADFPRVLFTCALLALAGCQSTGGGRAGTLSAEETQEASQVAFTVASADRCVVPYRQKQMLDALLARADARNSNVQHHNDTLQVYNEVFEGTRSKLATDLGYCTPERLAQTRADITKYGG